MIAEVRASLLEKYTVENNSREHSWISDEPTDVGGDDIGPKPTELFLSSLASCKLITIRMYAQRKEWDLQDARIYLAVLERGEKVVIQKSIEFEGDLDEKQKARLLDISGRCPVAKMLSGSIEYKIV